MKNSQLSLSLYLATVELKSANSIRTKRESSSIWLYSRSNEKRIALPNPADRLIDKLIRPAKSLKSLGRLN